MFEVSKQESLTLHNKSSLVNTVCIVVNDVLMMY